MREIAIIIEKDVIDTINALGILIVGLITAFVAYRQYELNKSICRNDTLKIKLQLYEKRFEIYQSIKNYLSIIFRDANIQNNDLFDFLVKTAQAKFLLNKEINNKIEELYKKGVELNYTEGRLKDRNLGIGDERNELAEKSHDLLIWFEKQIDIVKNQFDKYLKIED
jgi:hypothetical protein